MTTAELMQRVREVEIRTRRISRHLLMGGYHSAFKGRGMSFSEVRAYQFGDDVRNIDWNVTARSGGEAFVKIFEEEREQTVMLLVDLSASSFFGTGSGPSKQDFLTELSAALAFSAANNHDKVGLLIYSDQAEFYLPPATGRLHVLRIIRALLQAQPKGRGTNLASGLQYLHNTLKQRSICFFLSDFRSVVPFQDALGVLSKKHDCIGLHCWDATERELPRMGLVQLTDPETGQQYWADTEHPDLRKAYTQRFDAHLEESQAIFRQTQSDWLSFSTGEDYSGALIRFFHQRIKS
jgi:uncharacterized protein (DUF58 family)